MSYRTLDLDGSKPIALEEAGSLLPLSYIAETNAASSFIPNNLSVYACFSFIGCKGTILLWQGFVIGSFQLTDDRNSAVGHRSSISMYVCVVVWVYSFTCCSPALRRVLYHWMTALWALRVGSVQMPGKPMVIVTWVSVERDRAHLVLGFIKWVRLCVQASLKLPLHAERTSFCYRKMGKSIWISKQNDISQITTIKIFSSTHPDLFMSVSIHTFSW